MNEFYDELEKHWRLKPTAPVIVIDDVEEDENEVDLTEFFESVKAETVDSDDCGGGKEVAACSVDPYVTQEDPYLTHLELQVEKAPELEGKSEAPVAVPDAGQAVGNVKPSSGEVAVEQQPHTSQKPNGPMTPQGPVVKVPFTPSPKMSDQELTERIAKLKFLVCHFQNCFPTRFFMKT